MIPVPAPETILIIIVTVMAAVLLVKWASYFLRRSTRKWDLDLTLIQVLNDIIKYSIYIIALSIVLRELGIDVTAITVSLGIAGVSVGFASRDIISNFISGMFILADKSFRVGDTIEVAGQKGKVKRVGFRTTTIKTPDAKIVTVPNSTFSKTAYVNYSAEESRRVELRVNLDYDVDIEKFESEVKDVLMGVPGILKDPEPGLIVLEFTDTGIKAKVTAWVPDPKKVTKYRYVIASHVKKVLEGYSKQDQMQGFE
ncbi:mechanosensitive ion channel family protein [Methanothermobacter sp.]|uniref:mechanosensitive ion channel family protein n=1 Tax=Methanothermobacter sp. TaxID=1884223 RepID=UPI002634D86C|nr:mechanosensitive ion channel family protein [Methanothermobacter sp.]MDI9615297.1 mechanosensitive ion channel family protein [Methanothermobacter sp.]